ncbi:hypothetical protein CBR_g39921 [Chara braunii]|uniref:Uncharacterized protein n=1 Tax=Chara braunii TaxID=69332 RepID=A0A388K1J4_CHABU|nr:hypothetical protein CBR_g39921 [Chara braunii]|eukprot:GBG63916.1 hypothetical protein CBR_g39921 [Chara braunii]
MATSTVPGEAALNPEGHSLPVRSTTAEDVSVSGELCDILQQSRSFCLRAKAFFVAWQGVLTIAYSGMPPAMLELREAFEQRFPYLKENPGSRWPKTTLGAVQDNKRITPEQLRTLHRICAEESQNLAAIADNSRDGTFCIDNISIVIYENMSLEKTISVTTVPLQRPADLSLPSDEECQKVDAVLAPFSEHCLDDYWFQASKDGNRISHYKRIQPGATVVHYLSKVPSFVGRFKDRVDEELPALYSWLSEDHLHVTMRAIL